METFGKFFRLPFDIAVPPSGGSLEIGNLPWVGLASGEVLTIKVPPSGGSLEIGNFRAPEIATLTAQNKFPLRGDP